MEAFAPPHSSIVAAIGWFYLVTNSARVLTYVPQIVTVWRCRDGARSLSLITWWSWVVSHMAAIAYGLLVVHDAYFVAISTINFACCTTVACTATLRRTAAARRSGVAGGAEAAQS